MFELMKAFELASNEENKFLRFIYLKYIRYTLKKSFFKKFSIKDIYFDKDFLYQVCQFFECIHVNWNNAFLWINKDYTYVGVVNSKTYVIYVYYYQYKINISYINNSEYYIEITDLHASNTSRLYKSEEELNNSFIKEIILMGIYNICVAYIYDKKSKLYIHDNQYLKMIKEYF